MDELKALEYIENTAEPHKTLINISRGCVEKKKCFNQKIQDKVNQMTELGYIFFVATDNSNRYECDNQMIKNGVFHIGAINNENIDKEIYNIEKMYEKADYTSYGECIDLFAPGTLRLQNDKSEEPTGTSISTPIVAGVCSTIMSENLDIKYNFESMKKKLFDLSLKGVIVGLNSSTPNRLINNGKHSVYEPPRCDDVSGEYHCQDKSCSKYGVCVNSNSYYEYIQEMSFIEEGCQSEYGQCYTKKCGGKNNHNTCIPDYCCSKDGVCVNSYIDYDGFCFIENGCQSEFGQCSEKECGEGSKNNKCKKNQCCSKNGKCINVDDDPYGLCLYENGCQSEFGNCSTERCDLEVHSIICKEDQCCGRNGLCEYITLPTRDDIINSVCLIENGCKTGFSGQCLSRDINKIQEYPEKYHEAIKNSYCTELLNHYKDCGKMTYNFGDGRESQCDNYKNNHCHKILNSSHQYIPSFCEVRRTFSDEIY
ncbi:carbohydrate-binding module family 18 protein [Piromyces sp. E2]|nr:carbohydrate-binding module family 18 protein [Piromyces sp. E2]|eukprot:OUM63567.1 carbohydrate-binding module family 18 protein [Piromyces sp. E2]